MTECTRDVQTSPGGARPGPQSPCGGVGLGGRQNPPTAVLSARRQDAEMPLQPFQQAPRATARSESGRLLGDGHKPCSSAAGEALTGESPPGLEAEDPTPRDTSPRCPGKGVGGRGPEHLPELPKDGSARTPEDSDRKSDSELSGSLTTAVKPFRDVPIAEAKIPWPSCNFHPPSRGVTR